MSYRSLSLPLLTLAILFFCNGSACQQEQAGNKEIIYSESAFRNGDIIFQRGMNIVSTFVVSVDSRSDYSHVGIVYKSHNHTFVIHILPDDNKSKDDVVRIEPLADFLSPGKTSGIALYRFSENKRNIPSRAVDFALSFLKRRIHYDYDLDYKTREKLYCTELVWRAYRMADVDLIDGNFESVDFPFYKGKYILISNLLKSKRLEEVSINSI